MKSFEDEQILLGIDPGTRITGYGVIRVRHPKIEPLDFGCIKPPANLELSARYLALSSGLERLLDIHKPSAVAVETQFVYKNAQSAIKLGMARGVIIVTAARRGIPIFEYSPRTAKLAIVGNGSASKEQVQKMIQLLLKLPTIPEPTDACRLSALAICHANNLNYIQRMNLCMNTSKGR